MQPLKVVVILGSNHGGTTLLDLMLGAHKDIFTVGEMHAARPASICTCGKPVPECRYWHAVWGNPPWHPQVLCRTKIDYLLDRPRYYLAATHERIDPAAFTQKLLHDYRTVLEMSGKMIIADSSKEVERAELLAASPEVEPIIIHLVRDGRGTAWTYVQKYKKIFPYFFLWGTMNLKIELFRRRFKRISRGRGKFMYVRFADLVASPEATLSRLCKEIGVAFDPQMLRWDEVELHGAEGNKTRFIKSHTLYPDTKAEEMPLPLRALFGACFGWLNVYYLRMRQSFEGA